MRQSDENRRESLLLVGHGTRDACGLAEFQRAAALVREGAGGRLVEACYLELTTPTIAEGVARLAEAGVQRITLAPVLLFAAGHAKRDIPAAVMGAAAAYPEIAIYIAGALECSEHLLVLSQRRFDEALAGRRPIPDHMTLLLMVGRGSFDAEATAAMHRFAELRGRRAPVGEVKTCFVAMQRPSLAEALAEACGAGFERIVVQPHLLFQGELLAEIQTGVQAVSADAQTADDPRIDWVVTAPLGPEPELAAAILERAEAGTVRIAGNAGQPSP